MTQVGEIHLAGSGDVTMRLGAARGAPKGPEHDSPGQANASSASLGAALGTRVHEPCRPKITFYRVIRPERAKQVRSVPEITFIVRDFVPVEQRTKFFLKRHLVMMFYLIADVCLDLRDTRLTYGKRRVPVLPVEVLVFWPVGLHPLGTSLLDFLNDFLESMILRLTIERVNVIFHASDDDCGTAPLFKYTRLIRKKPLFESLRNPRLPTLRAIDEVDEIVDQRLGHDGYPLR